MNITLLLLITDEDGNEIGFVQCAAHPNLCPFDMFIHPDYGMECIAISIAQTAPYVYHN